MKPRNREVNIFNMSMLDVISGALGALIIVMVVLFPSYGKKRTEEEYRQLEAELKKYQVRKPFVVAAAWRSNKHDVDIFLDDGSRFAPKYDPRRKYAPYRPGDNGTELRQGPGTELRFIRDSPAGMEWKIYLNLYARNSNPAACWVYPYFLYGNDFYHLPSIQLPKEKTAYRLGSLTMTRQGALTFRGATQAIQRKWEELERKRQQKKQQR